jgi:hypothetical protein
VQCSAVQCSAVQCSAVQCSAVQCNAVLYSAAQHSTVQRSTGAFRRLVFTVAGQRGRHGTHVQQCEGLPSVHKHVHEAQQSVFLLSQMRVIAHHYLVSSLIHSTYSTAAVEQPHCSYPNPPSQPHTPVQLF